MGLLEKAAAIIKGETPEWVRTTVTEYYQTHAMPLGGGFQGILLKESAEAGNPGNPAFAERVSAMVGALGCVVALSAARVLILLPPSQDRELIAHRLSISLGAGVPACFAADTPDKALELIRSSR